MNLVVDRMNRDYADSLPPHELYRNDTFIRRIILGKGYIPPFMRGKKAKNTGLRAYTASTPNAEYLIVL